MIMDEKCNKKYFNNYKIFTTNDMYRKDFLYGVLFVDRIMFLLGEKKEKKKKRKKETLKTFTSLAKVVWNLYI
jgi:hypothetical protein